MAALALMSEGQTALRGVSSLAVAELEALLPRLRGMTLEQTRDVLIEVLPGLADRWGDPASVLAADLYDLPRPPRVRRDAAQEQMSLMLLSFMGESRRMDNTRLLHELRVRLAYPTVETGLLSK